MKTHIGKIIAAAMLFICSTGICAREIPEKETRWMTGGELSASSSSGAFGGGFTGIYGRQYSERVFFGVGFGMNAYARKDMEIGHIITHPDGSETVMTIPPFRYFLRLPVYADLQINLSDNPSPFFGEFKAGAACHFNVYRVRGTENSSSMDVSLGGVLLGAGIGKRFTLDNGNEINALIGIDCIFWPWYLDLPVNIGVRYCF